MKTLQELRESAVGEVVNIASPACVRNLVNFARQSSGAFQPDLPDFLQRVDMEVMKFGYSLGKIETSDVQEDEGEAILFLETFATHEIVKNIVMVLKWCKLSSGQSFLWRSPAALKLEVTLKVMEVAPSEMDEIVASQTEDGYVFYSA